MSLVSKYFWVFFLLGLLAGIFIKSSSILSPYILYFLMFAFFLSCLKIKNSNIIKKIKKPFLIIYLILLILIIVPTIIYLLVRNFIEFEYAIAILILLAMPAGMIVPTYATIFKGDKELALILAILTSLLCPITIPALIYLLSGIKTNINFLNMFTTLSMIIFIPFISAIIIKKTSPNFIQKTKQYYSSISILAVTLIIAGATAKIDFIPTISNDISIIPSFTLLFAITFFLYLIGYYIVFNKNKKTKITSSLAMAYMNSGLAIVFAAEFFTAKTLLLVTLYQIPTTLGIIIFGSLIKNNKHAQQQAHQ